MDPILPMYANTGEKPKPIKYYFAYLCFILLVTFVISNLLPMKKENYNDVIDDYEIRVYLFDNPNLRINK